MINEVSRLLAAGPRARTDLRDELGVHRNTWARHEARWVSSGALERVGRFQLALVEAPQAPVTATAPLFVPALGDLAGADQHVLALVLAEARSFVARIESLVHHGCTNGAPVHAPEMHHAAPNDAPECTTDAPITAPSMHHGCTTVAPPNAPECTTNAPKPVHPSRAQAVFHALPFKPTLRQACTTHAVARELPAEMSESEKGNQRKMKRFRTLWRKGWQERFPSLKGAPRATVLRNERAFVKCGLDELDEHEFTVRLGRFFDCEKAREHRYDVGFFVNGLHEDYAEEPEDGAAVERALAAADNQHATPAPSASQKEPESADVYDFQAEVDRMAAEFSAQSDARLQAEEAERLEREAWARQRQAAEEEARKSSPWRSGKSLLDAFA